MKKYMLLVLALACVSCASRTRGVVVVDGGDYQTSYTYRDRIVARDRAWRHAERHCHRNHRSAVVVKEDIQPNGKVYVSQIRYACR